MKTSTAIFSALQAIAGNKPAFAVASEALTALAVTSLRESVAHFTNVTLPTGVDEIVATPISISVDPATLGTQLVSENGALYLKLDQDFAITLVLAAAVDSSLEFSRVVYTVRNARFMLQVSAPKIEFLSPEFDLDSSLIDGANRDKAIEVSGIALDKLQRIEGAIGYVVSQKVVEDVLGEIQPFDLSSVLKAFSLKGEWALDTDQANLFVIPANGITFNTAASCPDADTVPDLDVKGVKDKTPGGAGWDVKVSGVSTPKPARVSNNAGFVSVYMPKPTLEARFNGLRLGLPISMSHGGFINWGVVGSVWLDYVGLTIDVPKRSILLDLEIHGDVHATVNVKVPCVGNKRIASADATLGPSTMRIRYTFEISDASKLVLRAYVDNIAIGKVDATVEFFSRWLGFAGGQALVGGLIADKILERIAEHNIPIELRRAIRDEVNHQNMDLLDLGGFTDFARWVREGFNSTTFSGDAEAILIGLNSDG